VDAPTLIIMTNAFDQIVIVLFDLVVSLIPTVLIIVGIVIAVGVVMKLFKSIILGYSDARKERDERDSEIERDHDSLVDDFRDNWGNDEREDWGVRFWQYYDYD